MLLRRRGALAPSSHFIRGELPVLFLDTTPATRPYADPAPFGGVTKRILDVLISACALVFLAPLLAVIAVAVKVEDGGPVMFVQPRVGRGGVEFRFLKFRSMIPDAGVWLQRLIESDPAAAREWQENQKLACDPRVTRIGAWLRRTSLDELPQFLNVLLGDMSVVGPRPMLREQVEAYGRGYDRYCMARPGITGLWQVSGRSETNFRRRSDLDQVYLSRWSLGTDLLLILRTAGVVLCQRGAR
jgi:undecaprenyl-phosphate galactose phosphotransferase